MENTSKISASAGVVAKHLLRLGSVQLSVDKPFTWASGIKSPIYCDNRKINSDVEARNAVVNAFVELIRSEFSDAEVIAGVATGGISFGALIADRLNLPFIYVRQAPKDHGLMKQVEGGFEAGQKTVVIEDLISTGSSSMKAVQGLRDENIKVLGLISIMTYGFKKAKKLFDDEQVDQWSLCNLDTMVDVELAEGNISAEDKTAILKFRDAQ